MRTFSHGYSSKTRSHGDLGAKFNRAESVKSRRQHSIAARIEKIIERAQKRHRKINKHLGL